MVYTFDKIHSLGFKGIGIRKSLVCTNDLISLEDSAHLSIFTCHYIWPTQIKHSVSFNQYILYRKPDINLIC